MPIEKSKLSIATSVAPRLLMVMHHARLDLFMIAIVRRRMGMALFDAKLLIVYTVVLAVVVQGALRRDQRGIDVGAIGICDMVVAVGRRR